MEVIEAKKQVLDVSTECEELLNLVEYHCSQCQAVYEDINVLNAKIELLYDAVVNKTRNVRDITIIRKNWAAAYLVAGGIRQAVCFKKQVHQICGIDSTAVDEVYASIKERLEFLLGYSLTPCE
jgi:hypothetical protein